MGGFAFYLLRLSITWYHAVDWIPVGAHPSVRREMEACSKRISSLGAERHVPGKICNAVRIFSFRQCYEGM